MGTGTKDSSRSLSPKKKGQKADQGGQENIKGSEKPSDNDDEALEGEESSTILNGSTPELPSPTSEKFPPTTLHPKSSPPTTTQPKLRAFRKDDILAVVSFLVVILASSYVILVTYYPELSLFAENPKVDPQVFLQEIGRLPKLHPDLKQQSFMFALKDFINRAEKSVVILCGENSSEVAAEVNRIAKSTGIAESEPLTVDMTVKRVNVQQLIVSKIRKSVRKYLLVTVLDIDQMSWDLPLALHAFGDLEIPDEKHILLVLSIKKKYLPEVKCDEFVQETLSEKWLQSGGNRDNIPPILSRIMDYTNCI